MEGKRTRKRPDLRLPGLRKNTRYAPARENGAAPGSAPRLNSPDITTCRRTILLRRCRIEAQATATHAHECLQVWIGDQLFHRMPSGSVSSRSAAVIAAG
jgi:hypothetical protein